MKILSRSCGYWGWLNWMGLPEAIHVYAHEGLGNRWADLVDHTLVRPAYTSAALGGRCVPRQRSTAYVVAWSVWDNPLHCSTKQKWQTIPIKSSLRVCCRMQAGSAANPSPLGAMCYSTFELVVHLELWKCWCVDGEPTRCIISTWKEKIIDTEKTCLISS